MTGRVVPFQRPAPKPCPECGRVAEKSLPAKLATQRGPQPGTLGVYLLTDPQDDQARLVGVTRDPAERLGDLLRAARVQVDRLGARRGRGRRPGPVSCWLAGLICRGQSPGLEVLEWVLAAQRENARRRWQVTLRLRGCVLVDDGAAGELAADDGADRERAILEALAGGPLSSRSALRRARVGWAGGLRAIRALVAAGAVARMGKGRAAKLRLITRDGGAA